MRRTDKENVVQMDQGRYRLRGELSFVTASSSLRAALAVLRDASGPVVIDLADIQRADSAGVALLIELVRFARERDLDLRFANLTQQVEILAAVSGVDTLIPRLS